MSSPKAPIIFIDEIDVIAGKRTSSTSEVDRRITAQLLTLMDSLNHKKSKVIFR